MVDQDADQPVDVEVVKHVKRYLDTGAFSRRSAQLGGEVIEANADLDQGVGQAFTREVSRLANKPGEAATPPQALMTDEAAPLAPVVMPPLSLSTLFGDPDAIRQAIMASEIFRRPRSAGPKGPLSHWDLRRVRVCKHEASWRSAIADFVETARRLRRRGAAARGPIVLMPGG